jgi:DNA replication and repair protein RecF
MFLQRLHLKAFRNYSDQAVEFVAPKTILVGDNAQGKTNLLEAVELLSTLRSHRASRDRDLIQTHQPLSEIQAHLQRNFTTHVLGLTLRCSGRRTPKLNGETLRRQLDLLGNLNTVQFSSLDLHLVRGGAAQRRDWLDALLIQLEPYAAYLLQQYNRVLRQRNALLRHGRKSQPNHIPAPSNSNSYPRPQVQDRSQATTYQPPPFESDPSKSSSSPPSDPSTPAPTTASVIVSSASGGSTELALWDAQLATIGTRVMRRRARALNRLIPLAQTWHRLISGHQETLEIRYQPNVQGDNPQQFDDPDYLQSIFLAQIQQRGQTEQYQGTSLVGPHRDEVELLLNGAPARQYGSQGQQRTIVLALKLAELQLLDQVLEEPPLLLLDDVLAELDLKRQNQLLEAIHDRFQTLITTTHLGAFDAQWLHSAQILTVQAGQIQLE